MATSLLTAVGTAVGGPVGGFIGGMLGAYIDGEVFGPETEDPNDGKGPKIDDFRFTQNAEGSPMWRFVGEHCRVPGTVIWVSPLEVKKIEMEVGGKGGGGTTITSYKYFLDMAIAAGEGEIGAWEEIRANSKFFWGNDPKFTAASNALDVTVDVVDGETFGRITSPDGGPNLKAFKSGADVEIIGYVDSGAVNDGTFEVVKSKKETGGATWIRYRNSAAIAETAIQTISLVQEMPKFDANKSAEITFYPGSETQNPSPLIESIEGVGFVPGYRGTAYFTIDRLLLEPYGNTPPQFIVIVARTVGETTAGAISKICERAGLTSAQYDVTTIPGTSLVEGMPIRGTQQGARTLEPILMSKDILMQERNGVIHFFPRAAATEVVVDPNDLAARPAGDNTETPMQIERVDGFNLPGRVAVKYRDIASNYQDGMQSHTVRVKAGNLTSNIDTGIVMGGVEARNIARRFAWLPRANRNRVTVRLPASYQGTVENDVLVFTALGLPWRLLIQRVDRGEDFSLVFETITERANILAIENSVADMPVISDPNGIYIPPALGLILKNMPGLTQQSISTSGFFSAAFPLDGDSFFVGAQVWKAPVSIGMFFFSYDAPISASVGLTEDALPTPADPEQATAYIDRVSTLTVELDAGTLSSYELEDMLNGAGRYLVGDEMIGAQRATFLGDRRYRLSVLLRGLRDTHDHMAHAVGERIIHLNANGLQFIEADSAVVGVSRSYKAIATGANEGDVNPQIDFALTAESIRPFRPYNIRATRSGTDIDLTWIRRSRSFEELYSMSQPLNLDSEGYEIDVYDGPDTQTATIVRTIIVSNGAGEAATYTTAQQTTDGLTPGAAVTVRIRKMSAIAGRGNFTEAVSI